jgi:hypothetical protein
VKKLAIAVAFCCSLIGTQAQAKTFVGVLWPMFGPLPAIGLVELTAEIRAMPDVEVHTYLHQEWPDLVKDMSNLPEGTRTIVIGYSLGANATSWVVNKSKYVDLVIALQPSMLSWNPTITGRAGRFIEVYNPNAWMTFGGMGSKKLEWQNGNIEYIANNDSHPGAQFNLDFRNLVKTEIAKMSTAPDVRVAQDDSAKLTKVAGLSYAEVPSARSPKDFPAKVPVQAAQTDVAKPAKPAAPQSAKTSNQAQNQVQNPIQKQQERLQKDPPAKLPAQIAKADLPKMAEPDTTKPEHVAMAAPAPTFARVPTTAFTLKSGGLHPKETVALLDTLSGTVNAGDISSAPRALTESDMVDYAKRAYPNSSRAGVTTAAAN